MFTWIGAREPYDERVSGTVTESASPELDPEVTGGIQSVLVSTAEQVVESQGFLVGSYLVLSGLLSLTVWRLFQSQFEQGAQAVAFSVFTVAHTVFLVTAARLLYVPTAYLSSGQAAGFPSALTYGITAAYVGIVFPWALGGGVKASAKGLLALSWAALEEALILGIAISAFLLWRIQNRLPQISLTDSPKVVFNWGGTIVELEMLYLLSIPLVPLLLHVALETYYRLR